MGNSTRLCHRETDRGRRGQRSLFNSPTPYWLISDGEVRMRTVSTLLIILFFLTIPRPAESQEPKKVDCDKDLKKAYELIDDDWSFELFKPGYVDLEREYARLEPEAKNTELPAECADIIARFMASLGDGHSRLQYYPGRCIKAAVPQMP